MESEEPFVEYQVTTPPEDMFVVPYQFWEKDDLNVRINDVPYYAFTAIGAVALEENYDNLDPTWDMALIDAAIDANGGIIILDDPIDNSIISIQRRVQTVRFTIFPIAGPFKIEALNDEFDRVIAMITDQQYVFDNLQIGWDQIIDKPDVYPPEPHTHVEAEILDLDKYDKAEVDASQAIQDVKINDITIEQDEQDALIAQNTQDILARVRFRTPYVAGNTYESQDMVRDGDWLMVANKQTSDRAAPQVSGTPAWDLPDAPAWGAKQHLGVVRSGREWDVLVPVSLNAYSVWVPTLNDDTNYTLWLYSFPTGQPELISYTQVSEPLLNENTWTEIKRDPTIILAGTTVGILLDALNSGASTAPGDTPADWVRTANDNNTAPTTGNWNRSNDGSTLRIHENTADAALIDMVGVVAGSNITFTSTDNPYSSITYRCNTDETYAAGVYSWTVQVEDTGPGGEPPVGTRCIVTFDVPVAAQTDYVEEVGTNPAATTRGVLELDGVPQAGAENNAYGVRIEFEQYSISDDWDIAGYVGLGGGGGGSGGDNPGTGASITIGDQFPTTSPLVGSLHYLTAEVVGLYVYYEDGDSTQWVQTNGGNSGEPGSGSGFEFPVGYVYMTTQNVNPALLFGYGTWVETAQGRAVVGVGNNGESDWAVGETRGSETHTLTSSEMPVHSHIADPPNTVTDTQGAHTHNYDNEGATTAAPPSGSSRAVAASTASSVATTSGGAHAHNINIAAFSTESAGGGAAHNNTQPSIAFYMFERTA